MKKSVTIRMKRRGNFSLAVLTSGFLVVTMMLYSIQIVNGSRFTQDSLAQQLKSTPITPARGKIYDRNGNVLSESHTVWNVLFSPADTTAEQAELIAQGMADILGVSREKVLEDAGDKSKYYKVISRGVGKELVDKVLQFALIAQGMADILGVSREKVLEDAGDKSKYYKVISRGVGKELVDKVLQFADKNSLNSLYLEETSKRSYPYSTLASSVLGFVNLDNKGAYGLEAYYNTELSGTPGRVVTAKNAKGTDMSFRYQDIYNPQDGNSIVTTIDSTIQQILEKNLRTAVIEHGVQNRAAGIFMDITTGEILGMATMPDFDPNLPNNIKDREIQAQLKSLEGNAEEYNKALLQAQFDQWNNKAISEPYEPGSVFKIITLAAALEEGAVDENSTFYCPGYYVVNGVKKSCWKTSGHGSQTLAEAVQNSCNPAFMMIGERLGAEKFYDYFEAFGLTDLTGIELPGEAGSLYHSKKALANPSDGNNSLTSCSFGQTFKVTPIQLLAAVAAANNGGNLNEPILVKRVLDAKGNVVSEIDVNRRRQVISHETSELVAHMLEKVVTDGSGKNAYVAGYRIGGKTGTSEKIDIESATGKKVYILSFVGVAPMDNPKYACLVLLDEPNLTNAYGSTVAAPVVGSIMAEALPYLGVEKVLTEKEQSLADVTLGSYIGQEPHAATAKLEYSKLSGRIVGAGARVVRQVPEQGTALPPGSTVLLYTEESTEATTVTVPDVRGMSGIVANRELINAGLNIRVSGADIDGGSVVAAAQNIAPGTVVERGTVIDIDFVDRNMREPLE